MHTDLTFKIMQLRAKNQNVMLTAVTVLIAALFITALLPSLLIQYVYAGQQLFKQPVVLEYIPMISFAIGVGYFLVAIIGNIFRAKRIKYLENQVSTEGCCGSCCDDDDEVLVELESLAEALAEKKAPAKKKAAVKKTKSTKSKK
jgi:hypothetical protein